MFISLLLFPVFSFGQNGTVISASPSLDEVLKILEEKMGSIQSLDTEFVQEKKLAIFSQTLEIKGKVYIQTPDKLAWHVESPMKYSMVMEGKIMRQWDEETKKIQKISLKDNPAFETALKQMKDWFGGAYSNMLVDYDISLVKSKPVTLFFAPKSSSPVSGVIESVKVTFREDEAYIKEIDILEKSGDETLLKFENTLLNVLLDPSVWELDRSVR